MGTPIGADSAMRSGLAIKCERVNDGVSKRREVGKNLGGRGPQLLTSQTRDVCRIIGGGEPEPQVAQDLCIAPVRLS